MKKVVVRLKRVVQLSIFFTLSLVLFPVVSCSKDTSIQIPYIPPLYYESIVVAPGALAYEYWNPHSDPTTAKRLYDSKPFIFKNILVDKTALKHREDGYLRLDMVKAYITNVDYLAKLKLGDLVDVVGINGGVATDFVGLNFTDCIVLPAGTVQIPSGETSGFVSLY